MRAKSSPFSKGAAAPAVPPRCDHNSVYFCTPSNTSRATDPLFTPLRPALPRVSTLTIRRVPADHENLLPANGPPRRELLLGKCLRNALNSPSHEVSLFTRVHSYRPHKVIAPVSAAMSLVTPGNDAFILLSIPSTPPHVPTVALAHFAHHPLYNTQHQKKHHIYSHALSYRHRPLPQQQKQRRQSTAYQTYPTRQSHLVTVQYGRSSPPL